VHHHGYRLQVVVDGGSESSERDQDGEDWDSEDAAPVFQMSATTGGIRKNESVSCINP
jgi:hypothetical protein